MTAPPGMPGNEADIPTAEGDRSVAAAVIHGGVHTGDTVTHQVAPPRLAQAASDLAREVRRNLDEEQKRRKICAPEPLPTRWRAVESLTNGQAAVDLPGDRVGITTLYRAIPRGRLVILGPTGAGKTVSAHRLALNYLSQRAQPGVIPVPVVFSIGSWDPSAATLERWMVGRLLRDHPFLDEATAADLITERLVLPVLDGFDELADDLRRMALEELNAAADRPLVLTSRTEEYKDAVKGGGVLYAAMAIELTGPSLEEAMAYLEAGANAPAWTSVRDRLLADPDDEACARLAAVLRNPLMAALARTAYEHRDPAQLLERKFRTREGIEAHLLGGFLHGAYQGLPSDRSRWSPGRIQTALGYLARHLNRLGGRDLAWWEIGITLSMPERMLAVGTLCGLLCWFVQGFATLAVLPLGRIFILDYVVADTLQSAAAGLAFGLAYGLTARFRGRPRPSRIQVRIRAGAQGQARRARAKFRNGFIIAALCTCIAAACIWATLLLTPHLRGALLAKIHIGGSGASYVLSLTLGAGLTLGLGLGLLDWFEAPVEAGTANGPLAFLQMNRATVRSQFLVMGPTFGLILGSIYSFFMGPFLGCAEGITFAAVVGPGWILSLTAWGQWIVFARVWLPLTGRLPWTAVTFLDDAHQRGVLRQSGAVYQFRHAHLQDHLAVTQASKRWAVDPKHVGVTDESSNADGTYPTKQNASSTKTSDP